jgi:hypothetical protein
MTGTPGYVWKKTARPHGHPTYRMYRGGERLADVDHNDGPDLWSWHSYKYPTLIPPTNYVTADDAKVACAQAHDAMARSK